MKNNFKLSLVALALVAGSAAQAQSAGTWMARVGGIGLYPQVSSGDLSPPAFPNTQTDVSSDWTLGGGVTYMITDNWSVDVPLALPFTHTLTGAGAIAGVGTIGTTKALPITMWGQYRFGEAKSTFRPYLGAGLTYAYFYDENATNTLNALSGGTPSNPTTFSIQSKWAFGVQAGATYAFNERWFLDGMVGYTWLKNTTTLSTGQTQPMTLNPVSVAISIGYKF
jgi:outer membrane protein